MHGELELGGPVYWALIVFMYACGGLALFVVIDALRARRAAAFADNPLSKWYWVVPQAAYFALFVFLNIPGIVLPSLGATFVIATPFALVTQVVYLLRVVHPAPGLRPPEELRSETQ